MKLLCAQVLKDLLGEGIDVSANRSVSETLHSKLHMINNTLWSVLSLLSV